MTVTSGEWTRRVSTLLNTFTTPNPRVWRTADRDTIRRVVRGISPYTGAVKPDGAARVVFNISSAHIPGFVKEGGSAYKNRYDVAVASRIGGAYPARSRDARELMDQMLASLIGAADWKKLYYGAVEINGAGIRYYGDVSLVLKVTSVPATTVVLDRNSFDLICEPLRALTCPHGSWDAAAALVEGNKIAGKWATDLADMAVCKVLKSSRGEKRRITIGAVSEGLLADEDYLEVIRTGSFGKEDVDEARLSAADVAVDGLVADRLRRGPTPDWAELLWRHRRRNADQALKGARIRTRVVVSSGRLRS